MDQPITLTTYQYTAAKNGGQLKSPLYIRQQGIELPGSPHLVLGAAENLWKDQWTIVKRDAPELVGECVQTAEKSVPGIFYAGPIPMNGYHRRCI
jgi:hypothetical protein